MSRVTEPVAERTTLEVRMPLRDTIGAASLDDEGVLWIHIYAAPIDGRLQIKIPDVIELRRRVDRLQKENDELVRGLAGARAELAAARAREAL